MTRTAARLLAVQLSFAAAAGSSVGVDEFLDRDYFDALPPEEGLQGEYPDEAQLAYIRALVGGIIEKKDELDACIGRYSRGWKLPRISRTALAVLRCAIYEILYMPEVPDAAAINEAVELAKGFDEQETVRFVNGILGSLMRERDPGFVPAEPGMDGDGSDEPAPEKPGSEKDIPDEPAPEA